MNDFKDKVVYQIYPKSFMDSNGDGFGDLKGVTAKLDYLADLGVDYLWLTPFFPSPQRDNGYDVADYRAVDPRYGTMEDLEELIREADRRGIGLMLDMVFNYTSTVLHSLGDSQHPFYFLLISSFLNIGLDWLFIVPLGMGVEGAAIATFISQAVGGVLPVFYFLNKRSTSSIHLGRAQWNGGVIRSACINGSSELMTNLSMSLVNILYNYQLLRFAGENGVAAYGVIMYAAFLFVAVFVGYAVGSAPIVSYHYGARNHTELNNLYSKSLRLIGVIAVVMTALSMLVIPYVARIFVGYDAELLALTSHAFRVYALNFFLMGFNVYGSSFFTALGDGVTSALISFLRTLLFQLLALILLPMVLGIEGVWLAVTAAEAGALCVTVRMFITKDKVFHYRKASC